MKQRKYRKDITLEKYRDNKILLEKKTQIVNVADNKIIKEKKEIIILKEGTKK